MSGKSVEKKDKRGNERDTRENGRLLSSEEQVEQELFHVTDRI